MPARLFLFVYLDRKKFGFSLGNRQLHNNTTKTLCLIKIKIYDSKVTREIIDLGDGRTISIETGKLWLKQTDSSVVVRIWAMPCY